MVDHEVIVRGLLGTGAAPGPTFVERTDDAFVQGLLDDLASADPLSALSRQQPHIRDGVLRLYQPVHRVFHLVVIEVVCDGIPQVRLDPARIDSAGLVLRRISADPTSPGALEGWRKLGSGSRGWMPLKPNEADLDPDPVKRRAAWRTGIPEIERRLETSQALGLIPEEHVTPLFLAPPEICRAAKKTLLYGLVPLTSAERSEVTNSPEYDPDALRDYLSEYLKKGDGLPLPFGGFTVSTASVRTANDPAVKAFSSLLDQLSLEIGAFEPEGLPLIHTLNRLPLRMAEGSLVPAGEFLRTMANSILSDSADTVVMPLAWPPIDTSLASDILSEVAALLAHRASSIRPNEGRFDAPDGRYVVRAFIREKRLDGCPPRLVWTQASAPFRIAPWYESSHAPPVEVELPDVFDREVLQALRPNVRFRVPARLEALLHRNTPEELLSGQVRTDVGSPRVDWMCMFNIPIITVCAFILLNIILQLFNLIFGWLRFAMLCIPIPRRR